MSREGKYIVVLVASAFPWKLSSLQVNNTKSQLALGSSGPHAKFKVAKNVGVHS